jgi:hypothetical protein
MPPRLLSSPRSHGSHLVILFSTSRALLMGKQYPFRLNLHGRHAMGRPASIACTLHIICINEQLASAHLLLTCLQRISLRGGGRDSMRPPLWHEVRALRSQSSCDFAKNRISHLRAPFFNLLPVTFAFVSFPCLMLENPPEHQLRELISKKSLLPQFSHTNAHRQYA